MLSRTDDYPVHQTPEPIAHPGTTDRNFYDRYWFNGFSRDGEFYFGIALGVYPNRSVMDASLSIVRDGEQHAFHASRRVPRDRSETRIGPFAVHVEEPMRRLRIHLDRNETGIECDLCFTARSATIEESRTTLRRGDRVFMDTTRFTQFGTWTGEVSAGGTRTPVDPETSRGVRDRSWGVRPVGEPEAGAPAGAPQVFFLWAPLHFEDVCTHFGLFESESAERWHDDGMIVPAYADPDDIPGIEDPGIRHMSSLEHAIVYEPGTRRLRSAELTLNEASGKAHRIQLEPLLRFQMKGLGYMNAEWGHGFWKGEEVLGAESWKCDSLDPLALDNMHTQTVVRARMGDREGVGVLEQLCIGPHRTYGFESLLDGAR